MESQSLAQYRDQHFHDALSRAHFPEIPVHCTIGVNLTDAQVLVAAGGDARGRRAAEHRAADSAQNFLRRIIVLVEGQGGVTLSYVCPLCHRYPLEDYIWCVSTGHGDSSKKKKRQCNWWCAACGCQYDRRNPSKVLALGHPLVDHWVSGKSAPPGGVAGPFFF